MSDWQAHPPPRQPTPPPAPPPPAVPANWGTAGVPMVIVAPPQHDGGGATRGVAGWYILVIMTIAAAVSVYFAYQTWKPGAGVAAQLSQQQAAFEQQADVQGYRDRLETQTQQMGRNMPAAPTAPNLIKDIQSRLDAGLRQQKDNIPACQRDLVRCAERTKTYKCPNEAAMKNERWCSEVSDFPRDCTLASQASQCVEVRAKYCEINRGFCIEEPTVTVAEGKTG